MEGETEVRELNVDDTMRKRIIVLVPDRGNPQHREVEGGVADIPE